MGVFPVLAVFLSLAFLASACGGGGGENPFGVKSEVVTIAERPFALTFAPDGRLFYGEQFTGNIRVITPDGELQKEPFAHVDAKVFLAWGLTGLALDPDFETNGYVYALYTEAAESDSPTEPIGKPVLVRFTDQNNKGVDKKIIVGDLPDTNPEWPGINGNGSLHFGPDGFLYFTMGDYNWADTKGPGGKPFSLDFETPIGKMLRIDKEDGEAPPDNLFADQPDADPRIFARGFLKAFNFVFHPESGQLYGTDGTTSCEELNVITAGGNYGWPEVGDFPWPDCFAGEQIEGIHFFSIEDKLPGEFLSTVSVSGMEFVSGDDYPLLGDSLLVCESDTELMRRLILSGANLDQVTEVAADEEVDDNVVVEDCQMDITVSPEGIVYYSNETEIRQLVPELEKTPES
jgi:glucose/arabinose dehydrogenase